MKIVLQKFIASSGYCSRRKAEELIRDGRVSVNNNPAELGMKVDNKDEVKIRDRVLKAETKKVYIILNKPEGYVCTNRKFKDEKNIFDLLVDSNGEVPELKERLFVVGRLDKNSKGLVLLTNDGELAQKITHPKYEHEKTYLIDIQRLKMESSLIIKKLKAGVDIGEGDGVVKVKRAKYVERNKFEIVLTQGKKRQIRRMFQGLGLHIVSLKRQSIGNICLNDLPQGRWECLSESDIKKIK